MRNIQKISLATAMIIGLVGCGGNSSSNGGSGNLPPVAQPPVQQPPVGQPPVQQPPQQVENHIEFKVLAEADWDLISGAFIANNEADIFKWTRDNPKAYGNLAAAVYNSAGWNNKLKEKAFEVVIQKIDLSDITTVRGWDLLVYDQYDNSDLFNLWIQKRTKINNKWYGYGDGNGVYDASAIRDLEPNNHVIGYDTYGALVGLYRANKKGFITTENLTKSIGVIEARLKSLTIEDVDYAYFKLIEEETGIHIYDYPKTINASSFGAQNFAFAVRAYGAEGIQMTKSKVEKKLIENTKNAITSLTSIDNLEAYYDLTNVDITKQENAEVQQTIDYNVVVRKDWDLNFGSFIADDGIKWTRTAAGASKNVAAGVYNATKWNSALLEYSKSVIIANQDNPLDWDLLVYDTYDGADLFNNWIAEFGNNGIFDAGPNKSRPNRDNIREIWGAYDAYGKVIGMYRAYKKGYMTEENFDKSVENVKVKLATYFWTEADNSYFKLIFEVTGKKVHDYSDTITTSGFSAQELGFAVQAYDLDSIVGHTKEELKTELLKLAKDADTSLSSIDALAGFNVLK